MEFRRVQMQISHYWEKYQLKHILGILIGSLIVAVAIQVVIIPAHLLTGGISGLSIILQYATHINVWVWYAVINIPIFIAGYRFVNRRFVVYSLVGAVSLTVFLYVIPFLHWETYLHTDEPLLSALLGGVIIGLGSGLIFRCQGSSGGVDIIAVIIKRKWDYSVGQTSFLFNLFVIIVMLTVTDLSLALFSTISIFVSTQVLDAVVSGGRASRTVMIISDKSTDISAAILYNLRRGCTILNASGGYSGEQRNLIMVTIGKTQLPLLKDIVFSIDHQAFIVINESIEVFGRGFRSSENRGLW